MTLLDLFLHHLVAQLARFDCCSGGRFGAGRGDRQHWP
jgi:hypothetical protein